MSSPEDPICPKCKGSGYWSAAREAGMENLPYQLQPMGVYHCPRCGGNGKDNIAISMKAWRNSPEGIEASKEIEKFLIDMSRKGT